MNAQVKTYLINEVKKHIKKGGSFVPNDNRIMLYYFGDYVLSRIEEVYLDDDDIVCVIVRRINDGEENCLDYNRLDEFSPDEVETMVRIMNRDGLFDREIVINVNDCKKEYVADIDLEYLVKTLLDRDDTNILDVCGFDVEKLKNYFKPTYSWRCLSYDGYTDESDRVFDSEEKCYNDMRDTALEKMKWNTEYAEDFEDGGVIDYRVWFVKNKIVHHSYSGTYVYMMYRNDEKPSDEQMLDIARLFT